MGAKIGGWISSIIGGFFVFTGILSIISPTRSEKFSRTENITYTLVFLVIGAGLLFMGIMFLFKAHKLTVEKRNIERLFDLKRMFDAGIINEKEFNDKKEQILEVKQKNRY